MQFWRGVQSKCWNSLPDISSSETYQTALRRISALSLHAGLLLESYMALKGDSERVNMGIPKWGNSSNRGEEVANDAACGPICKMLAAAEDCAWVNQSDHRGMCANVDMDAVVSGGRQSVGKFFRQRIVPMVRTIKGRDYSQTWETEPGHAHKSLVAHKGLIVPSYHKARTKAASFADDILGDGTVDSNHKQHGASSSLTESRPMRVAIVRQLDSAFLGRSLAKAEARLAAVL
jgi:hypothetical protein